VGEEENNGNPEWGRRKQRKLTGIRPGEKENNENPEWGRRKITGIRSGGEGNRGNWQKY
jgi:hypothetical protein